MARSPRTDDDIERSYRCGQCDTDIEYLANEEPTVPCPDCGWWHKDRKKDSVPEVVRLDLTKY